MLKQPPHQHSIHLDAATHRNLLEYATSQQITPEQAAAHLIYAALYHQHRSLDSSTRYCEVPPDAPNR